MSSAGGEKPRRLFFALWPDAVVRRALEQSAKVCLGTAINRVPAGNLHLTLAFAGVVSAPQQRCLEAAASDFHGPCFALAIDRLGHWPKPRILWAAPGHIPVELCRLSSALREALVTCGITSDTRPYQPHITLARKQSSARVAAEFPTNLWSISEFSLIESVTDPAGVRYCVLRTWALGSG